MESLSSGCAQLDALLEALWPGDNVVFVGGEALNYVALYRPALAYAREAALPTLTLGEVPDAATKQLTVADIWDEAQAALRPGAIEAIPPRAYLVIAELSQLLADEEQAVTFFTTVCPALYQRRAVAYWHLAAGAFSPHSLARIRDCTQVFIRLERNGAESIITPLKVQGRYADDMFRPHRLITTPELAVLPLRADPLAQGEYALALESKNRELTAIRDELNRVNALLEEQSRLYDSLSTNLDQLVALLDAGRHISLSLSLDQVRQAIVRAALALFQAERCRLIISGGDAPQSIELTAAESLADEKAPMRQIEAAIAMRTPSQGLLQVWTRSSPLSDEQLNRLLGYLASEAAIALDNAELYREAETQREQLRTFVSEVIANEERDSRQLAFDLHDGLVQQIVAAYQHLQSAQAWRDRAPEVEERELERGVRILQQSIVEARRLIGQLRPAGLDDFGLAHAVRLLVNQQADVNEWDIALQVSPAWPPLPPTVETALYRIIQEATNNAHKYARSPRLAITLSVEGDALQVTVQDWGQGFDPDTVEVQPEPGLRMGLMGIRERANLLGGTCEIDSAPGRGTRIVIRLPRELAIQEGE